jgi:hypothetical protein
MSNEQQPQDESPSGSDIPDHAPSRDPQRVDVIDSYAKPHRGFILGESLLGEDEL